MTNTEHEFSKDYPNVAGMLQGIPQNAWYIFYPSTESRMAQLEVAILALRSRESTRNQVMAMQRLCGFPLRPNVPLREAKAKARLEGKKKEMMYRHYRDRHDGDRV